MKYSQELTHKFIIWLEQECTWCEKLDKTLKFQFNKVEYEGIELYQFWFNNINK